MPGDASAGLAGASESKTRSTWPAKQSPTALTSLPPIGPSTRPLTALAGPQEDFYSSEVSRALIEMVVDRIATWTS